MITGTSQSDCLVSHQDTRWGSLTSLQRCSRFILHPQPTGPENIKVAAIDYEVIILRLLIQFSEKEPDLIIPSSRLLESDGSLFLSVPVVSNFFGNLSPYWSVTSLLDYIS